MALRTRWELPHPRVLYKHLLRQSTFLPDAAVRYHVATLTRLKFRQNQRLRSVKDAEQCSYDAFTHLKRITRANFGATEELTWLVGHTYGFFGPVMTIKSMDSVSVLPSVRVREAETFPEPAWGARVDTKNHPIHPRVRLTAPSAATSMESRASLERFAASLPKQVQAAYLPWAVFASLIDPVAIPPGEASEAAAAAAAAATEAVAAGTGMGVEAAAGDGGEVV